ncbi:hypothetical protein ACWDTR_23945 [Streptomyces sp. NPDC003470]|uniref:hypothetical protein n=1 Tax=Streptomyces sp. NPDC059701 TaxID=3346914 RepID=UPI0036A54EE0
MKHELLIDIVDLERELVAEHHYRQFLQPAVTHPCARPLPNGIQHVCQALGHELLPKNVEGTRAELKPSGQARVFVEADTGNFARKLRRQSPPAASLQPQAEADITFPVYVMVRPMCQCPPLRSPYETRDARQDEPVS